MTDEHSILILGEPTDPHVAAVAWWLRANDIPFGTLCTRKFPASTLASASISAQFAPDEFSFADLRDLSPERVAGVWNRRRPFPQPRPNTHQADLPIVTQQSSLFLLNLMNNIAPSAKWVNGLQAQRLADLKLGVLNVAKNCGFNIPETLASNDPEEIRAFAARHSWRIIAKNFVQGGWRKDDGSLVVLRTSALTREQLDNDSAIAKCPMIYQPLIDKVGEWRITVMGNEIFPFEITSSGRQPVDWRTDVQISDLNFVPCKISDSVAQSCISLCRRLGLEFGCIDILRLSDGSCIFLEVNEGGQFLWLEERNPDVPLLDAFGRLLCSSLIGNQSRTKLRLDTFHRTKEWQDLLKLIRNGTVKQGADCLIPE